MLEYSFTSPIYLLLTVLYFLTASVVTLDLRLTQARKFEKVDYGTLPPWVAVFQFLQWALFIALFILNWKIALALFFIKFILKVLPVLELIGNVLMSPFKPKK